ncbi:unnamed protein product [Orchesella dallaii]|uniref:Uncharacterized protein n=1 Tax=Orchesella dallaii TaxID=48710 RepID=A0ABP1R2A0_9HEXA
MAFYNKSAVTFCACAVILLGCSIVFQSSEGKTVTSRASYSTSKVSSEKSSSNVFMSIAKSLMQEAFSEFQETARRNPRLGFNLTLPMLMFPDGNNTQAGNGTRIGTLVTNGQLGMSQV